MKKILIVADGILAKSFLEKVVAYKEIEHHYTIISYKSGTLPEDLASENFKIYNFDPTSYEKLSIMIDEVWSFDRFMVIVDDEFDANTVYKNLRKIDDSKDIYLLDNWNISQNYQDDKLYIIDLKSIVTTKILNSLPDFPVYATSIGNQSGEIIEIRVPISSSFAYKKMDSFRQTNWKIALIYRKNEVEIPNKNSIILPNDKLLLVGNPLILKDIFRRIKQIYGHFPALFGSNIYLLIDMQKINDKEIQTLLSDVLKLNEKLNNRKIFIRVTNPTTLDSLETIKSLRSEKISVLIYYGKFDYKSDLQKDINENSIGLIVVHSKLFKAHKKEIFTQNKPILKVGSCGIESIAKSVVIGLDKQVEQLSSTIFDVCLQLDLDLDIYHYDPDCLNTQKEMTEHFYSLSKLFHNNLNIISDCSQNPIKRFKNESNILQFIPFNEKLSQNSIISLLSKDLNLMYHKLDKNYQIFIPTNNEIN